MTGGAPQPRPTSEARCDACQGAPAAPPGRSTSRGRDAAPLPATARLQHSLCRPCPLPAVCACRCPAQAPASPQRRRVSLASRQSRVPGAQCPCQAEGHLPWLPPLPDVGRDTLHRAGGWPVALRAAGCRPHKAGGGSLCRKRRSCLSLFCRVPVTGSCCAHRTRWAALSAPFSSQRVAQTLLLPP